MNTKIECSSVNSAKADLAKTRKECNVEGLCIAGGRTEVTTGEEYVLRGDRTEIKLCGHDG